LADAGKSIGELASSVFVEKLDARGYEVLLLNQPVDEILVQNLQNWKYVIYPHCRPVSHVADPKQIIIEKFPSKMWLKRGSNLAMKVCSIHYIIQLQFDSPSQNLILKTRWLSRRSTNPCWIGSRLKRVILSKMVRYNSTRCYEGPSDQPNAVVISSRLVSSPCAIVADFGGYTANVERMIGECSSQCLQKAVADMDG
jgi:hypothetical protein